MRVRKQRRTSKPSERLSGERPGWIQVFLWRMGERGYFADNLSILLTSGIDLLGALEALKLEIRSKSIREMIGRIQTDVASGVPLWRSLQDLGVFSQHLISLVRIGEETGRLSENFNVIAQHQERERVLRSKIQSAMTYPVIVVVLAILIGSVLSWFILPRLANVYSQLNLTLPFVTKVLIAAGKFLGKYGAVVIPIFLVSVSALSVVIFGYRKTQFIGEALLRAIPGIRRLTREMELSRSGYMLGTLLQAGVPILEAFDSLIQATTSHRYRKLYVKLRRSIEEGNSFHKSFSAYDRGGGLFPIAIQQMIVAGERSGRLPETLVRIGQSFEAKVDTTAKNVAVLLEPLMLILVWLVVAFIAIAVILPIYQLIGSFNSGLR